MNREYKFRAWNGEEMFQYGTNEGFFAHAESNNWPIMQFTGLKDMNGVEVYDQDILHFNINNPCEWLVVWNYHGWYSQRWVNGVSEKDPFGIVGYIDNMKIIGNRFEHPHLLEAKK